MPTAALAKAIDKAARRDVWLGARRRRGARRLARLEARLRAEAQARAEAAAAAEKEAPRDQHGAPEGEANARSGCPSLAQGVEATERDAGADSRQTESARSREHQDEVLRQPTEHTSARSDGGAHASTSAEAARVVAPAPTVTLASCWVDRNRGKFACQPGNADDDDTNVNELFTQPFSVLASIYENGRDAYLGSGRAFKARGFKRAASALKRAGHAITTPAQVDEFCDATKGVGESIRELMKELLRTGTMERLRHLNESPDITAVRELQKVWGIGPGTAHRMIQRGIRTLAQLRNAVAGEDKRVALSRRQLVGLELAEELDTRMPRDEAGAIAATIEHAAQVLCPGATATPCGSYRRGAPTCGDVDVLITHADASRLPGLLGRLLQKLSREGFLTHHLIVPKLASSADVPADEMSFPVRMGGKPSRQELPSTYMGVCVAGDKYTAHRRVDIKVYPPDTLPCAALYFTGSGHFNRSMRLFCKRKGLKLSDTGLWHRDSGRQIKCTSEEDIFKACGLEYVAPRDRSV